MVLSITVMITVVGHTIRTLEIMWILAHSMIPSPTPTLGNPMVIPHHGSTQILGSDGSLAIPLGTPLLRILIRKSGTRTRMTHHPLEAMK